MLWPLILSGMSLINRKQLGPPTKCSSKPTAQLKTTLNTASFHRQYASGTHYQSALLCQTSPWISLKLWSKVKTCCSPLYSFQFIFVLFGMWWPYRRALSSILNLILLSLCMRSPLLFHFWPSGFFVEIPVTYWLSQWCYRCGCSKWDCWRV
jgi:hypothetical protein